MLYNGFNDSGDYNCSIPAQYDVQLNPQSFAIRSSGVTAPSFKPDVFCTVCSQRQAYKIEQLAQFEPTNEANWDRELSQFKKELENRCMLCPSCMIKVHKRINNIDIKMIPKVLLWWRSKNYDQSSSPNSSDHSPFLSLIPIISTGLRIITTFIWLYMSLPFVINLFDNHVCKLVSTNFLKVQCQCVDFLKSEFTQNVLLFQRLKIVCLGSHLSQLLLQTTRVSTSPFFALLDAILFVLSTNLIITGQKVSSSAVPSIFILILVLIVGIGVLVYCWLPYAQEDLNIQIERLKAAWPTSNPPPTSSYYSAPPVNAELINDTVSLSLDGLSLNSGNPPHSANLSPTTLTSFTSQNHVYAASAAPAYSYLHKMGSTTSPLASGDFDAKSHFTSVSQMSRRLKREKRRHRRGQPTGLLRLTLYLLFGRLETWSDVKSELLCMFNAVLVGVLLILICHLFYVIMPGIWTMKV
ncbi:unnamed protein product [Hymenolepis diminuta]|uniref:Ima1_N domain-containing protein n=1 Tax=Hymenolepis diminuta TaxID=6216 RepID=A0A0R3SFY3_HYMDI|nr:unnamed protein product [Hymenolepis diminuta]